MPIRLWHLMTCVLACSLLAASARVLVRLPLGLPALATWAMSGITLCLFASPLALRLELAARRSWLVNVGLLAFGGLAAVVFFLSSVILVLLVATIRGW